MTFEEYGYLLMKDKSLPNFWCSIEFWVLSGWVLEYLGGDCWIMCEEGFGGVLPPVTSSGRVNGEREYSSLGIEKIWALLPGMEGNKFLDWNFFYQPKAFLSMEGKRWMKFRKNSRKFPRRWGKEYEWKDIGEGEYEGEIRSLLEEWLEGKEEIHGGEELFAFCFRGRNRWGLFSEGWLLGMNVWDYSLCSGMVNYRYLIARKIPFLDEYMRLSFYLRMVKEGISLVNDGGSLGDKGLERFKWSLNPFRVEEVYSWERG